MNHIIKENYEQDYIIYDIIKSLPNYIVLNDELVKLLKNKYELKKNIFTVNSLVSIFEFFEAICWKDFQKNILPDYKLELTDKTKDYICDYFGKSESENKIINKKNFTGCLGKLISRSITGTRQEIDIKTEIELKLYINLFSFLNINRLSRIINS